MGLFKKKRGTTPVPGEGTVSLPAGKVIVNYEEARQGREVEGGSWHGTPDGVEITIRPAGGGDALPIQDARSSNEYSNLRAIGSRYGSVEIPVAGEYTVTVAPFTPDRELFEPRVMLKA